MRRLVATSLLIACAGLTSSCGLLDAEAESAPELGALETFTGKGYRIKLPCIPAKSSQTAPVRGRAEGLPVQSWACEGPDTAYAVSTSTLPPGIQGNLDGAAQGAADAVDGTVVMNKRVIFSGLPARDVRIESTFRGEPTTLFGRVLVRKRVVYQVQGFVFGEHTKRPPALYGKILKSLTFR